MAVLAVSITSGTSMLGMKYNAAALASDGTLTLSVLIACLVKVFFVCFQPQSGAQRSQRVIKSVLMISALLMEKTTPGNSNCLP